MTTRWTDQFKNKDLDKGLMDYMMDNVSVRYAGGAFYGTFSDGSKAIVRIPFSREKGFGRMTCTCAQGKTGRKCSHMAAVMYSIQDSDFEVASGKEEDYDRVWTDTRGFLPKSLPELDGYDDDTYDEYDDGAYGGYGDDDTYDEYEYDTYGNAISGGSYGNGRGEKKTADPDRAVVAFRRPDPEKEIYYDLHRIMAPCRITAGLLEKAQSLIREEKVVLKEVSTVFLSESGEQCLRAEGVYSGRYRESGVVAVISARKLESIRCNDFDCYNGLTDYSLQFSENYGGGSPCEHQLALLLLLEQYILDNNPGDATNYSADMLLHRFRNRYQRSEGEEEETPESGRAAVVRLEPRLLQEGEAFELGFRIGKSRSYILKDMQELISAYSQRDQLTLGKNNVIDFAGEDFDERSKKWFALIERSILESAQADEARKQRNRDRYRQDRVTSLMPSRTAPLYGSRIDEFFDIALQQGRPLEYEYTGAAFNRWGEKMRTGEKEKRTLTPMDQPLRPRLEVKERFAADGSFTGVSVTGELPEIFFGTAYAYYITRTALCRFTPGELDSLRALLESRDDRGNLSLFFGRRAMSQLFHRILPSLEPHVHLEMSPETMQRLEDFIPPEAEFAFWLDAEDESVLCRADAVYGEQRYNLTDGLDTSRQPEPGRDSDREDEILGRLSEYFGGYGPAPGPGDPWVLIMNRNDDDLFRLLDTGLNVLMQIGEVHTTDRFDRLRIRRKAKITIGVSMESGLMDLDILSEDIELAELVEILESFRQKRTYHRLKNGDFLKLDDPSLEELSDMLDAMRIPLKEFVKGKMHLPAYRALYLDRMLEESEGLYADRDRRFRQMVKEFHTVSDSDFEVPGSLRDVLRGYQKTGYQWLRTIDAYGFGGVLADEMGLGKTLQMIAVLLAAKEERAAEALEEAAAGATEERAGEGQPLRALVVTPASLVYNWEEEIARFAPELRTCVIAGTQKARQELIREAAGPDFDADILITSYDLLKRDIQHYEGMEFSYEIIDEAQFIKNHSTAAAKAVKVIRAARRFALTGTPIENRLSELWSIFDFLMPGFLYGYEVFRREFEVPIAKRSDEAAGRRLKRMVSPFILRRLKADVLTDLPEKLEEIRYVNLQKKQRKIYDGQVVRMKQMLAAQSQEDFARSKIQILAELTRIRQICCDPSLLLEDYTSASAKREAAVDLMVSAAEAGHKMLVFSQFTSMLALLEEDLTKNNLPYYKIIGETPKLKRTELVRAFNEDDTPVFLISLKAGGTGLNLTGADIVIHYDPWWNVAVQNQATDRAHRIGQEKTVTVYRMIARDTIEEKIVKIQESKKELAEEILSGETGSITRMSREELMELL